MTGIIAQNVGRTSGLIKSAGGGGGVWTKIKEITASADSTIDFVDGTDDVVLDSTYPIYLFKYINIHNETDEKHFQFQGNAAGGSGYNETITSTAFAAYHNEGDSGAAVGYEAATDQAQGTAFQMLSYDFSADNDHAGCGYLYLFNPSSTTFVKHFIARTQYTHYNDHSLDIYIAGYFNTTSAIDEIQFKMSSGNIDSGKIKLYGLKDSA